MCQDLRPIGKTGSVEATVPTLRQGRSRSLTALGCKRSRGVCFFSFMSGWCHLAFSFSVLFFLLRLSSSSSWTAAPRTDISERVLTTITAHSKAHFLLTPRPQRFPATGYGGMLRQTGACSTESETDRDRARGGPSRRTSLFGKQDPCGCRMDRRAQTNVSGLRGRSQAPDTDCGSSDPTEEVRVGSSKST
ncbi:hypothetical protein LX36DRAFT_20884 [Colletotrichum falcatum]|nr:hypothetical protein LX36DRAFT_20884 [Colletotrichum falcatum]